MRHTNTLALHKVDNDMDRFLLVILLVIMSLSSCQKTEEIPFDQGLEYQPLEIGLRWLYQVNETIYFGENDLESSDFFYRDHIVESFENELGLRSYIIQRSKSSDRNNWQNHITYSIRVDNGFLVRNVENEKILPFQFPPQPNRSWDGNLFNTNPEDLFSIEFVNRHSVGQLIFNNVVKVNQENEDDLITVRDNRYEIFAKNVGLIESFYEVLAYCSRNECLGEQRIESGRFTHIKLLSYDKI